MVANKALGPNGVAEEFYKALWLCLGAEFHQMILKSIGRGALPKGVIEGLIVLIHKGGGQSSLNN
jgi:hypothetical protein